MFTATFAFIRACLRQRGWWVWPVFCLGGILVYWPVLRTPFLSDDYATLGTFVVQGFYWTWGEFPGLFFRPLMVASHWLDYRVWGLEPWPHHLVNSLWHGVNAALVTGLARVWLRRFAPAGADREVFWPAVGAGALFLVLPTHAAAVAYVSSRNDLLATFFSLLALISYIRYLEEGRQGRLAVTLAALAAGLFSKESVFSLGPIFLLLGADEWRRAGDRRLIGRRVVKTLAFSLGVFAAYYGIRFGFIRTWVGVYGFDLRWFALDWWFPNLVKSLWLMVVPVLAPEQAAALRRWPVWLYWVCGLGGAGLLAWGAWRSRTAQSAPPGGGLAVLGLCAVTAAYPAILFGLQIDGVGGEHWLYLPTVFVCLGGVGLGLRLVPGRRARLALLAAVLLVYTAGLQRTLGYWRVAGEMVRVILRDSADQIRQTRLLVLNLPDNCNGAYVFRIGYPAALYLFARREVYAEWLDTVRSPELRGDPAMQLVAENLPKLGGAGAPPNIMSKVVAVAGTASDPALPAIARSRSLLRELNAVAALTRVEVASFHTCRTAGDRVRVRGVPGGVDLELECQAAEFLPMPVPAGVTVESAGPRALRIRFPAGIPEATDIFYWDEGRLKRWTP